MAFTQKRHTYLSPFYYAFLLIIYQESFIPNELVLFQSVKKQLHCAKIVN